MDGVHDARIGVGAAAAVEVWRAHEITDSFVVIVALTSREMDEIVADHRVALVADVRQFE